MKPNQIYFERAQGPWQWSVEFEIFDYPLLWRTNLSWLIKLRISTFALTQKLMGPFQMRTFVNFMKESQRVRHSTRMMKWGIPLYSSEKTFFLDSDGLGLRLEGSETFWPMTFRAVPFLPSSGAVDESTTEASYQMPLAGTFCDCKTFLAKEQGYILISTPWLRGRFALVKESMKVLSSKF